MLKIVNLLVTVLKRVGKIALFDKALVVALACGALAIYTIRVNNYFKKCAIGKK